jgi:hypothetical protein
MKRFVLGLFFILSAVLMVSSCASTSQATTEKTQAAKEFKKVADKGVVYLYRPGRFVAAAVSTAIKVNGQDAGGTGPGTFFRWELKPGTYVFSAKTSESAAAVEVDVKAGEHYFVMQNEHIGLNTTRVSMKLVDEKTGTNAVSGAKLLVSSYVPEQ